MSTFLIVILSNRELGVCCCLRIVEMGLRDKFRTMISHHHSSLTRTDILSAQVFMLGSEKILNCISGE